MDFFIKEENVRPGNRGGRDQFKWDNIRLLNNKDRESYLGVTQSIGFLDKGGKWRRRDWWLTHDLEGLNKDSDERKREIDIIKKEEERILRETLYPGLKEKTTAKGIIPTGNISNVEANTGNNIQKTKLTDYEWKEMMKKEGNIRPDDSQLYEFYENEDKKAGIGMKQAVSFRTNPYGDEKNLTRLDGVNINKESSKEVVDDDMKDNPYLTGRSIKSTETEDKKKSTIVNKYINEYMREKKDKTNNEKEKEKTIIKPEKTKHTHKSKKHESRSRSRSRSPKKHRKHNRHSRSRSRNRDHKHRNHK
jgi:hypothetical protein